MLPKSASIVGVPAVLKIGIQEIILFPTDREGNAMYNTEIDNYTRTIKIMKFSVAINVSNNPKFKNKKTELHHSPTENSPSSPSKVNKSTKGSSTKLKTPKSDIFHLDPIFCGELDIEEEYIKICDNDSYFILPIDITLRMGKNFGVTHEVQNVPKAILHIELKDCLMILVNKPITKYIVMLNQYTNVMNVVQKNLHLRPVYTPSENKRAWWRYAIKSVVEEINRRKDFSAISAWKMNQMKKYIDLFKRNQNIVIILML